MPNPWLEHVKKERAKAKNKGKAATKSRKRCVTQAIKECETSKKSKKAKK